MTITVPATAVDENLQPGGAPAEMGVYGQLVNKSGEICSECELQSEPPHIQLQAVLGGCEAAVGGEYFEWTPIIKPAGPNAQGDYTKVQSDEFRLIGSGHGRDLTQEASNKRFFGSKLSSYGSLKRRLSRFYDEASPVKAIDENGRERTYNYIILGEGDDEYKQFVGQARATPNPPVMPWGGLQDPPSATGDPHDATLQWVCCGFFSSVVFDTNP